MVDVLVCISASPERFAQIEIRSNQDYSNILKYYDCAANDIGYQLSLDSDEYNYVKIVLAGPISFIEGLKEKIQTYFLDSEIIL